MQLRDGAYGETKMSNTESNGAEDGARVDRDTLERYGWTAAAMGVMLVMGYTGYQSENALAILWAPVLGFLVALIGGMTMGMRGWGDAN